MQNKDALGKAEARRIVGARLGDLSDKKYKSLSQVVYENLTLLLHEQFSEHPLRLVLSYKALPRWREVDVSPLEQEFKRAEFEYAPALAGAPLPGHHYDLILVPVFGFNHQNYRLGHGGGWYDRLLSHQPEAIFVGVGLSMGLTKFAAEPHDVPLHYLVTEKTSSLELVKSAPKGS